MIYIITTETFPNGLAATQRIKCYAKSMVELGVSCEVLCANRCENPSAPLGNLQAKGEIDGYAFRYMGGSTVLHRSWKNKIFQIADTFRLIVYILRKFSKYDKVIFYSYNAFLRRLVVALSKLKGYKVFFELNEHPSIQLGGFIMDDDNLYDRKRLKKELKGIEGFLCISKALSDLLIKCGIEKKKTYNVNMLVDSSRFEGLEKQEVEPYIGYCGAADNNKDGVDQLIKAFGKIANKYPMLRLHIMGPRRQGCTNEALAKKLGIGDRVLFTGMVSSTELPQKLMNARLLALDRPQSRQARYGFPTKLGEYLLTGNPVVVTAVGDVPMFLKDGESAYLAEPDNVDSFAEKLDFVLSHTDESKQVGNCGRDVALKNFSGSKIRSQLKEAMNL